MGKTIFKIFICGGYHRTTKLPIIYLPNETFEYSYPLTHLKYPNYHSDLTFRTERFVQTDLKERSDLPTLFSIQYISFESITLW